ncbi:hypothetical protein LXL04_037541 [Taraxacum kok-saghyz]
MTFKAGDAVEVSGSDGIFKFSFHLARIRFIYGDTAEAEYQTRIAPSGLPLVEVLPINQIRPVPDIVVGDFNYKDAVEVWLAGGDPTTAIIHFAYKPTSQQNCIFPKTQLRIHQEWCVVGNVFWHYKRRLQEFKL